MKEDGTFGEPKYVCIQTLELVDGNIIVDAAYGIKENPGIKESIVREDSCFSSRVILVKRRKDWGEYSV
jgi:hypothetical protein